MNVPDLGIIPIEPIKHYWVSCNYATCLVSVRSHKIIDVAPIWNKFKGQSITNLLKHIENKNPIIKEIT